MSLLPRGARHSARLHLEGSCLLVTDGKLVPAGLAGTLAVVVTGKLTLAEEFYHETVRQELAFSTLQSMPEFNLHQDNASN
jgi:hypothetical protein